MRMGYKAAVDYCNAARYSAAIWYQVARVAVQDNEELVKEMKEITEKLAKLEARLTNAEEEVRESEID